MSIPLTVEENGIKRDLDTEEKGAIARRHLTKGVIRLIQKGYEPKDILVLSATRKGQVGVEAINTLMQELLNMNGMPVGSTPYRVGDRIMQKCNNYGLDVFNGDQGYIVEYNDEAEVAKVQYEGRAVEYKIGRASGRERVIRAV